MFSDKLALFYKVSQSDFKNNKHLLSTLCSRLWDIKEKELYFCLGLAYSVGFYNLSRSLVIRKQFPLGGGGATHLIPALGRQRQADLCQFEASLVYRAGASTGTKAKEKPCHKKWRKKERKKEREESCFLDRVPSLLFFLFCSLHIFENTQYLYSSYSFLSDIHISERTRPY